MIPGPHMQSCNMPWEIMPKILFIQSSKICLGHVKVINIFKIQYKENCMHIIKLYAQFEHTKLSMFCTEQYSSVIVMQNKKQNSYSSIKKKRLMWNVSFKNYIPHFISVPISYSYSGGEFVAWWGCISQLAQMEILSWVRILWICGNISYGNGYFYYQQEWLLG